ncbi:MAG: hypothetical protein HY231_27425 [Acidobacteria bacterium]|nr:hypothetical protein [Acidobacteriota bacterium]
MANASLAVKPDISDNNRQNNRWATLRSYEFLAFSIIGFVAKSVLLIRLPYRDWYYNAGWTTLLLAYFYCFFRFRFKATPPLLVVFSMLSAVGIDVAGNYFHLYGKAFFGIEYDEYTHLLGSAFSLIPVMWVFRTTTRRMGFRLPPDMVGFLSTTITFSLCAYYEILELWDELFWGDFERIHGSHDTANDLMWDLGGIIIAALVSIMVYKTIDRREAAQLQIANAVLVNP